MKLIASLLGAWMTVSALSSTALPVAPSVPLFNGTNLDGWITMQSAQFSATNGVIHLEKGRGWLRSVQIHGNFILTVDWRGLEKGYNSGIFVRAGLTGNPWPENVWQINTKQTGIGELLEGPKRLIPSGVPPVPAGEWVTFRIEARGTRLTLSVNGKKAWTFDHLKPATGFIGLQAEGKPFEFRNLQITELPPSSVSILLTPSRQQGMD